MVGTAVKLLKVFYCADVCKRCAVVITRRVARRGYCPIRLEYSPRAASS